jgi:SNF2 family DNA or RNA helicase
MKEIPLIKYQIRLDFFLVLYYDNHMAKNDVFKQKEKLSERIFRLDEKKLSIPYSLFINELTRPLPKSQDGKEYLPVVYLEMDPYQRWMLYPGLRIKKKTGKLGIIQKYNPEKVFCKLEQDQQNFYNDLVHSQGSQSARLESRFQALLDLEIPVYPGRGQGKTEPMQFIPIEKMEFDFRIRSIHLEKNDFHFRSHLIFHTAEGLFEPSANNHLTILIFQKTNFLIVIGPEKNCILYRQLDKKMLTFLNSLLNEIPHLNAADIKKLKQYIQDSGWENFIAVTFERKAVNCIEGIIPVPVLYCESLDFYMDKVEELTSCRLFFRYREREIEDIAEAEYLVGVGERKDKAIKLYKRNAEFEKGVKNYLFLEMRDTFIPSTSFRFRTNFTYALSLPFKAFLDKYGAELTGKGFEICLKGEKIRKSGGNIHMHVESGIDWFDFQLEFEDESGIHPIEVDLHQLLQGKIKTKETLLYITQENVAKIQELIKNGMDPKGKLRVSKKDFSTINELYELVKENNDQEIREIRRIAEKLADFSRIEPVPVSGLLHAELRSYQQAGLNWLHFLHEYELNGCLADDMGLGKTVQTIALLAGLFEKKKISISLIIAPVTTLANWEYELKRFAPDLKVIRHFGTNRNKDEQLMKENQIILSSYHTVRNDIEYFSAFSLDYLILDEAQNIKNHSSQIYKAVKMLNSRHKLALSGTPVENNEVELWALMNFLNPGLLGTVTEFKNRYIKTTDPAEPKNDQTVVLRKKIHPFVLRRKKQDVLKELPEKEVITYFCEMADDQQEFYQATLKFYREKMENAIDEKGVEKSRITMFEGLLRLRQSALFPGLIDSKYNAISACKFETAKDILDDLIREGHKILFFSQFIDTLKWVGNYLTEQGCPYCYLDGSTRNREEEITRFQTKDEVKVFLLSLKAGGVGINLHAANYVILFDPWWNPAVEAQAIDRCHRLGQMQKVTVYKLITKNSIEEKILKLQESKKKLFEELITEESSIFKSLSREEILDLFT